MRALFPREARLRKRREFTRVYREGARGMHQLVVLYHARAQGGPESPTRFGITVSRKISRRAVDRNRIRRVWREAIRLSRHRFEAGWDIVLNSRMVTAKELNMPEAQRALLSVANARGLLRSGESIERRVD